MGATATGAFMAAALGGGATNFYSFFTSLMTAAVKGWRPLLEGGAPSLRLLVLLGSCLAGLTASSLSSLFSSSLSSSLEVSTRFFFFLALLFLDFLDLLGASESSLSS